jgi:regulatory protein
VRRTGRGGRAQPEDLEAAGPPGDPVEIARIICLRMLDRRAYSRAELAAALQRRGVSDDAAGQVLDRFAELRLVDDAALADGLAVAVHRERGLAGRAVAHKLRSRGIPDDAVQAAVGRIDRDSERATARRLVERRLRALAGLEPRVQARRLVGLLARKGYPPALAREVVRAVLSGADELTDENPGDVPSADGADEYGG